MDGLWFADNVSTPDDESLLFNTYVNMFYEECTESEAELIVFYEDAAKTSPYHAAIRNSDDTYSYKPGAEGLVENQSYSEMRTGEYSADQDGGERFFKLKN